MLGYYSHDYTTLYEKVEGIRKCKSGSYPTNFRLTQREIILRGLALSAQLLKKDQKTGRLDSCLWISSCRVSSGSGSGPKGEELGGGGLWKLKEEAGWQPARKQEPPSHNHKELNSANDCMSLEENLVLPKGLWLKLTPSLQPGGILS